MMAAGVASTAYANGEVVLNPGNIAGTIQMGSQQIRQASVFASFQSLSSSQTVQGNNATSVNYDLTVNVPEGTTPDYRVSANLFTDNFTDFINFT